MWGKKTELQIMQLAHYITRENIPAKQKKVKALFAWVQ